MAEARSNLIYDVGLFDGEDTAYYLWCGYNVVAIDANPVMIEQARLRFAREIEGKRLTLLNIGISEAPGVRNFWISDMSGWSSFDETLASRDGVTPCRPTSVPVVPFAQILSEHGVPHYLKVDIEGSDRLCVEALGEGALPKYVSVEAECAEDSTMLDDEQATAMLGLLRNAGYRRFKLVDQSSPWGLVRPSALVSFCMRLLNSAAHGRLRVKGLSGVVHRLTDSARIGALGYPFSPGSTGPWGEDIPCGWMPFDKAKSTYLRERRAFLSAGLPPRALWYDWHATVD